MPIESFSHPFYDIEIERVDVDREVQLIKILSVDGRRFTYELRGALTEEAVEYIKSLIDRAVFGDLVIEAAGEGLQARESPVGLKKHS